MGGASTVAADGAGGLGAEEVETLRHRHADDGKCVMVTKAAHLMAYKGRGERAEVRCWWSER